MAPVTPRLKILSGSSIPHFPHLPHTCESKERGFLKRKYLLSIPTLPPPHSGKRGNIIQPPFLLPPFFSYSSPFPHSPSRSTETGECVVSRPDLIMADLELMRVCSVGGNAVSAFLSWRLQATNACDVTLVWKSGFEAVYQYGISFK